jgi:hypothetical protein
MFQDVAGIWKVLVREDFFMHQMEADAPNQMWERACSRKRWVSDLEVG